MASPTNVLTNGENHSRLKIIIVGCGLGGLACAIACRREGLDVLLLEKANELSEIGAGIQLPPNATRVMSHWGLMDKIYAAGGVAKEGTYILRWSDGRHLATRPGTEWAKSKFNSLWHVMHRADYQRVLADEARRLGADLRLDSEVIRVDCNNVRPVVTLATGERLEADVVVGADGLRSEVRTSVLGYVKEPSESGDLAYRVTIPRADLEDNPDPFISGIVEDRVNATWWGPDMHVVMYGIRADEMANLVLICPDNLPPEVSRLEGDLAEMHKLFETWDPRLQQLLSKVNKALKWKVWTMEELDVWVKGSVALLGDACHPSVPYAARGAAMAVEDGAVLGRLLGLFSQKRCSSLLLPDLLRLYQSVRKKRAETTVQTANENRILYHMADGPEQEERDSVFGSHDWWHGAGSCPWVYADMSYLHELYGFDALKSADEAFGKSDFGGVQADGRC